MSRVGSHAASTEYCFLVGPASQTVDQHQTNTGWTIPANTKHLYNICTTSAHRWSNIVQMLYKCFVFAGSSLLEAAGYLRACLSTCSWWTCACPRTEAAVVRVITHRRLANMTVITRTLSLVITWITATQHNGRGAAHRGNLTPANTSRWANVVLMLGQRRKRWTNI